MTSLLREVPLGAWALLSETFCSLKLCFHLLLLEVSRPTGLGPVHSQHAVGAKVCQGNIVCGSRDSLLVERGSPDRKVASSSPGRSGGRIFFSGVNFLC